MADPRFHDEALDGSTHLVVVSGELDFSNTGGLQRRLDAALAEGRSHLIVDLTGLIHMDSTALAVLIRARQAAHAADGELALVVTSRAIRRTLEIRGIGHLFALADTREAALAHIA